jgi:hypothetical protein
MARGTDRDFRKEFVAGILAAAGSRRPGETLADCCRMMACSIWKPFAPKPGDVEREYAAIAGRYAKAELEHLANAFGILCEALEARREEFLGGILEREFRATNTANGQFLTPPNIARLMGDCLAPDPGETGDGRVVRLCDPCCGAGVLAIHAAESFLGRGVRQGDLCVVAGDIDRVACDMCYVQLSLLGYAGVVRHENSLTMERLSEPRYTPGWFLHGFPMRGIAA